MPALQVRPFRRADRDQLTELINTHVAAVVPGVSVSVNTVLSALERQPDEFITDPWVSERVTLVAEQRGHVVAAAHLLRYRADDEVGPDHRDIGEIDWFIWYPPASFRPDSEEAASLLMSACPARLARWNVRARYASGELPAPAVYGLPRTWPHIRAVYEHAGFRHVGDTEVILVARVADLPPPTPRPGVTVDRTLGECGTRFTAYADGRARGFIEVDTALSRPERHPRGTGLADVGNLHIDPAAQGEGLEHRLLGQAADWLRLCGVDRLLAYEAATDRTMIARLTSAGFRELTRTDRRWEHRPG
ncbi:GNAT family N-acetyltransferase [Streptomyces sp. ISL-22]|uniref:GNAT family N-acetyltransferase n=1 Tax=unclassified Streptomyces TaxID=2593676 RepID=UPI001BEA4832|nr:MULTISPECIES: GNAT family N-acetyltransferase [unclassified Streptomyces]MBT2421992.1 GNAT family N-acetyltransferase [Streptomyces sp. ISL-24]MBT2432852.1 GNAT family N-acetyltransferase [Streptomyces sp. ISL-22]